MADPVIGTTDLDYALLPWLEDNGVLASIVLLVISIIIPLLISRFSTAGLLDEIKDRPSWPTLITRYSQTRAEGYYIALDRLLNWADRFYGPDLIGKRAFNRCLSLAFLYPVFFYLFSWVFFNVESFGGLPLFEPVPEWWKRALIAAYIIALSVLAYILLKKVDVIQSWLHNQFVHFTQFFDPRDGFLSKASRGSLGEFLAVAGAVVVAGVGAGAVAGVGAGAVAGVVVVAVAGAVAGVVVVVVVVAGIVVVVGAVAGAGAVVGAVTGVSPEFVLFVLVLPTFNGLVDTVSVAVTRKFLRDIHQNRPGLTRIALDLILDIIVALLCLGTLLGLILGALELWTLWIPIDLGFDWRAYWAEVKSGHIGATLPLALMAGTTLLPSLVHAFVGLAAFFASESQGWKTAVLEMQTHPDGEIPVALANDILRNIQRGWFWAGFKALILIVLLTFCVLVPIF